MSLSMNLPFLLPSFLLLFLHLTLIFLIEFDYVSSPVPSPIVAGSGVVGTTVAGPGLAGSASSLAAPDASWVVASGNMETLAPLHMLASGLSAGPLAGAGPSASA